MDSLIRTLNRVEEGVLAFTLLAIAIFTVFETALRYTVSYTFTWFNELANYSMIFFTYLGASVGVKYGTHFSMEAVTEYAPDRASHLVKAIAYCISGIVALLFCYYGTKHLIHLKSFNVKSSAMQIPMFIPYIPIPLFSVTMAFRFFNLSFKHLRSFVRREPYHRVRKAD
jgi:C4-dicarboxylate transporter DctQ subunit